MKLTRNTLRSLILKEMKPLSEANRQDELYDEVVAKMQDHNLTGPITNVLRSVIAELNLTQEEAWMLPELIGSFASTIASMQLRAEDEGEEDLF